MNAEQTKRDSQGWRIAVKTEGDIVRAVWMQNDDWANGEIVATLRRDVAERSDAAWAAFVTLAQSAVTQLTTDKLGVRFDAVMVQDAATKKAAVVSQAQQFSDDLDAAGWRQLCAVIMHQFDTGPVTVTAEDFMNLPAAGLSVATGDGYIKVALVDAAEVEAARQEARSRLN